MDTFGNMIKRLLLIIKTMKDIIKNQKEIGIIGHIGHFGHLQVQELIAKQAIEKNIDVIIVDTKNDNTFTINGITYEPVLERRKKSFPVLPMFTEIKYGNSYERKLPENINIIKEFKLIQNKCSKLSKWERDEVIRIFKSKFREIKQ